MRSRILTYLLAFTFLFSGLNCGLFKKSVQDSEGYKELLRYQEEAIRKADSLRRAEYQETLDSSNREMMREIDSIQHNSDSIERELEKNIIKQNKKQ